MDPFEVAGKGVGGLLPEFESDFALDTLQIGGFGGVGQVRLVDDFDNQPDFDGSEAVYVDSLIVTNLSLLDLNDLRLCAAASVRLGVETYYAADGYRHFFPDDYEVLTDSGEAGLVILGNTELGDMNGRGAFDSNDINPFVLALTDREAYIATYGLEANLMGDMNGDGMLNGNDIHPFVDALVGSSPAIPEPASALVLLLGLAGIVRRKL